MYETKIAYHAFGAFAAVGLAFYTPIAIPADWSFSPKIALSLEYDDNHRMTAVKGQEIEVSGGSLDALVAVKADTPRTSFRLIPRLRSTYFPGDADEETDDQFLRLDFRHKGQRNQASIAANYSRVDTLGNYFPQAVIRDDDGLGNPESGEDIGSVDGRNRQERLALDPAISFELAPRHALELEIEYLDVGYDVRNPGEREDYTSLTGGAGYRFQFSETADATLRASVGQYEPDVGASTDGYGITAEWRDRISATSEWYVRAGMNRVQSTSEAGVTETNWESGFSGGAGVRWSFEVTEVFVDLNRYLDPNSTGTVVTRDQLRVEVRRRLSPVTTAFFGARAIKDQGAADGTAFQPRDYLAANLGFEWRMSRQLSLAGRYQYSWQEYEGAATDAQANSVTLGIVYEPRRL